MVDSHCHLADRAFAADLDVVIARAGEAGVTDLLCILAAGDASEAAQATRVTALCPGARFAVGVHPHEARAHAGEGRASAIVRAAFAENPLVRAVGGDSNAQGLGRGAGGFEAPRACGP